MAQTSDSTPDVCEALQLGMRSVMQRQNPARRADPVGLLQATLDPENRRTSLVQQLQDDEGHSKEVRVRTLKRSVAGDTTTAEGCPPGSEVPSTGQRVTVNQYQALPIKIPETRIRELCNSASRIRDIPGTSGLEGSPRDLNFMEEVYLEVLASVQGLRVQIEKDILTTLSGNIGGFAADSPNNGATTPPTVDLLNSADNSLNLKGWNTVRKEYQRLGLAGRPFVVSGYDVFNDFNYSKEYGCCNDNGIDFSAMADNAPYRYYVSPEIASVFAADEFIVFAPETIQFTPFNRYVGNFAGRMGTMDRGTMQDLFVPGLTWDIRVYPDECADPPEYNVILSLDFDLYVTPTNHYKTGDRLAGTNGVFSYIGNAA